MAHVLGLCVAKRRATEISSGFEHIKGPVIVWHDNRQRCFCLALKRLTPKHCLIHDPHHGSHPICYTATCCHRFVIMWWKIQRSAQETVIGWMLLFPCESSSNCRYIVLFEMLLQFMYTCNAYKMYHTRAWHYSNLEVLG